MTNYTMSTGEKDTEHDPPLTTRYLAGFDRAHEALAYLEGGLANHPKDPGKLTNYGITTATYQKYIDNKKALGHTLRGWPDNVRHITPYHAKHIYYEWYWLVPEICTLPYELAHHAFIFGVNAGPVKAIQLVQRCLGLKETGDIDDETYIAAWTRFNGELIMSYAKACRRYYRSLKNFSVFGEGWLNRVDWALRTGNDLRD